MTNKIYAYAWFRRSKMKVPGGWVPCKPEHMPQIIKTLRYHRHAEIPGPGEVLFGSTMSSRYDYIYVKTELPAGILDGLEEV